jgi:Spy/CpxP family protein refolding chaperone
MEIVMEKRKVPVMAALVLIAALLLIPGFTVSAQARQGNQKVGPGQFSYGYGFQKPLKLTAEEQKTIRDIVSKDQSEIAKARAEIRISQAKISRLMLDDNPDMAAISAELDRIAEFEKTIKMIQIQRQIEIKKLLGEDRYNELVRVLAQRRIKEGRSWFQQGPFDGKKTPKNPGPAPDQAPGDDNN